MVKGYEFSKDRYVTFTPEELKALEEQSTQSIEVVEFVPIAKVDPVYFDKTYYVGPDKGGAKAYALLSKVMQETGRVALARYAARGKQYLVLLRPLDGGIVMQQLYYADEVRSFADVPVESAEVSAKELDLAKLLVDQRATDAFKPETYEDDVKKRILGLIQKKVEGQEISIAPPEAGGGQIIDLMEALKASLAKKPEAAAAPAAKAASAGESSRKPAKRAPARVAQMRKRVGAQGLTAARRAISGILKSLEGLLHPGSREAPRRSGREGARLRPRGLPLSRARRRGAGCASPSRISSSCARRGGLADAGVPPRRIRTALRRLREKMPEGRPLTEVRIAVEGSRDRRRGRLAALAARVGSDPLRLRGRGSRPQGRAHGSPGVSRSAGRLGPEFSADDWYEWACELEPASPAEARDAYERALELDPRSRRCAREPRAAAARSRATRGGRAALSGRALVLRPEDATAAFNLGVALEDLGSLPEALLAYEHAVRVDPGNADAHFNAAALAERLGPARGGAAAPADLSPAHAGGLMRAREWALESRSSRGKPMSPLRPRRLALVVLFGVGLAAAPLAALGPTCCATSPDAAAAPVLAATSCCGCDGALARPAPAATAVTETIRAPIAAALAGSSGAALLLAVFPESPTARTEARNLAGPPVLSARRL